MEVQLDLISVPLAELRPTQITVGFAEVKAKREEWEHLKHPKERNANLASHCFPAVLGPGKAYYIVDHHHLGLALKEEGVEKVWIKQLNDFSGVPPQLFWLRMEFGGWAHPYDENGKRCDSGAIPSNLGQLRDDPYRSLAGFVRKAGGCAKDATPFTEFLWAEYFRQLIPVAKLQPTKDEALLHATVQEAVLLACSADAKFLPGWTGGILTPPVAA